MPMMDDASNKHFDLSMNIEEPHAFIQWKGTDVCMDFWCECGAHLHFDGYFAYAVRCPHCKTIWQMPSRLFPRKADGETYPGHIEMARNMEPDEDFAPSRPDRGGEGMKLDPEIVEVVARALNYEDGEYSWELTTAGTRDWYSNLAQVALAATIPLIEAAVLERAAKVIDDDEFYSERAPEEVATAIRALKKQP